MKKYEKLFSPIQIGRQRLRNRIVMSPMDVMFTSVSGEITEQYIDYIAARARGGAGLIISEAVSPDTSIGIPCSAFCLDTIDHLIRLHDLADTVHMYGAKMLIQLDPGVLSGERDPVEEGREVSAHWSKEELAAITENFAKGASMVASTGLDGIEIASTGGYVLNQLISPATNTRTDEYNGDTKARAKILTDSIRAVVKLLVKK